MGPFASQLNHHHSRELGALSPTPKQPRACPGIQRWATNKSHARTGLPSVLFLKIKLVALSSRNKGGVSFRR